MNDTLTNPRTDTPPRTADDGLLRASERRLAKAQELAHLGSWELDLENNRLTWTDEVYRIFGLAPQQFAATYDAFLDVVHPEDRALVEHAYGDSVHTGKDEYEIEHRIVRKSTGEVRYVHEKCQHIKNAAGKIVFSQGMVLDITDRIHAEHALAASEARQRLAIAAARIGIHSWDVVNNKLVWDARVYEFWGLPPNTPLTYELFMSGVHPDDRARVSSAIEPLLQPGGDGGYHIRCRVIGIQTGIERWLELTGQMYFDLGQPSHFIGTAIDITQRIQIQEKAQQHERDMRSVLDNMPAMIGYWDKNLRNRFGNRAYYDWFGIDSKQMPGMHIRELLGEKLYHANQPYIEAALRGETQWFERSIPTLDGGRQRYTQAHYLPDFVDGEVRGFYVLVSDITTLKNTEIARDQLNKQLLQAQKMESIGRLTGGIAHDFNNILGSVLGYTELALERCVPDKSGKLGDYLREVQRAAERARDLVANMLAFARGGKAAPKVLSPAEVVREVHKMLSVTLPATIQIVIRIPDLLPHVRFDPAQLHQVVTNLVINAQDAFDEHGCITIELRHHNTYQFICDSCHASVSGQFVELRVSDNGHGIATEDLTKIFDPFYTTKDVGKGTGLGLSTVHGLVHDHGGHMQVESALGAGTMFRVLLPTVIATEAARIPADAQSSEYQLAASRHILVVDDEPALAELMHQLLEHHGYRVSAFTDSTAALEAFRQNPHAFNAVITDQTMPGLTGLELNRELKALRPELPVILTSGYSASINADTAVSIGVNHFLQKPLTGSVLLERLTLIFKVQAQESATMNRAIAPTQTEHP